MGSLLQVDPTLTRADRLVGQVLGEVGALPDVFTELEINFFLLRRLLGVRTTVSTVCLTLSGRILLQHVLTLTQCTLAGALCL